MDVKIGSTVYFDFVTSRFDTGAATNADSTPTAVVYEDNGTSTLTGVSVGQISTNTGEYRVTVVATSGNGYEDGKTYNVWASATVNSVAGKGVIGRFVAHIDDITTVKADTAAILSDTGTDGVVVASASKAGYSISGTKTTLDALNDISAAQVNVEVDTALNTAIPVSPTADSINQRIAAMDDLTQASGNGDLAAILTDTGTTLDGKLNTLVTNVPDVVSLANIETQVNDALDAAGTELSAVPTTTGTLRQKINWLFEYFRNKKTITSTTETLFKEDASTSLGTSTVSANSTTFTKGEMN